MKKKILLIDDHRSFAESLARQFQAFGSFGFVYETDETRWKEAIATHEPDLLLLDIDMPRINGHEIALELSKQFPDLDVLLFTALRSKDEERKSGGV